VSKGEQEKTGKLMIYNGFYRIKIDKSMLPRKLENDDALA